MPPHNPFLLDVTRLIWRQWTGKRATGIDHVCLAYLENFGLRSQAVIQSPFFRGILSPQASKTLFALLTSNGGNFRWGLCRWLLRFGIFGAFGQDGGGRIYLNVGHTGLDRQGYRRWCERGNIFPVYLLHDLIPLTHPHLCREGEEAKHRQRITNLLLTAKGVIGNSDDTLRNLKAFAAANQLPCPPVLRAWLGTRTLSRAEGTETAVSSPTFLVLGTIEARKNHKLLLDIWSKWGEKGLLQPKLLIVGQRGWEVEETLERLDNDANLAMLVSEIGEGSDEALSAHLSSACALLFPSLAEGYGMPVAEALAAGIPIISADLPAVREFAGDAPEFLDPYDGDAWADLIMRYAAPRSAEREAQKVRLKTWVAPTWQDHFARVEDWLSILRRGCPL